MKINAGWEQRSGEKLICRWFAAWDDVGTGEVAGAIAGFSGGGSFLVERFYGKLEDGNFTSLWIDLSDRVSGQDVEFDDCGEDILAVTESALEKIWEWNDNDVWCDSDEVVLIADKSAGLAEDEDMLFLDQDSAPFLHELCEKAGLTASPGN